MVKQNWNAVVGLMVLGCALSADAVEAQLAVVLETDRVQVTTDDLDVKIDRIPEMYRIEVLASKERIKSILEGALLSKTLAAEARKAGLDREAGVQKRLSFQIEEWLAQEYLNHKVQALKQPSFEQKAREQYKINSENYALPERVSAAHILIDREKRTEAEMLQRCEEVRAKALAGEDFAQLAVAYSDDPTAQKNQGELGEFDRTRMVAPFSEAAFALKKPGEISQPVVTEFGCHIIKLGEKIPPGKRPYERVKDEIIKGLQDAYLAQYRQKLVSEVLQDPSIKLNVDAVEAYRTHLDYAPAPEK